MNRSEGQETKGGPVRNLSTRTTPLDGRRAGSAYKRSGVSGVLAAIVLALAFAVPASASPAATATLAPIGTGSYLLTLTNVSSGPLSGFVIPASAAATANVAPAPACRVGTNASPIIIENAVICTVTVAPGASTQVCYTGSVPSTILPGEAAAGGQVLLVGSNVGNIQGLVANVTLDAAVASCPLPGFGSTGGTTKCVVPSVKGKKLATAEKAITKARCAVGKVKKASSKRVKKGNVISTSPAAGKSLPKGSKISLVISKG
jgi:hypothetical protein